MYLLSKMRDNTVDSQNSAALCWFKHDMFCGDVPLNTRTTDATTSTQRTNTGEPVGGSRASTYSAAT